MFFPDPYEGTKTSSTVRSFVAVELVLMDECVFFFSDSKWLMLLQFRLCLPTLKWLRLCMCSLTPSLRPPQSPGASVKNTGSSLNNPFYDLVPALPTTPPLLLILSHLWVLFLTIPWMQVEAGPSDLCGKSFQLPMQKNVNVFCTTMRQFKTWLCSAGLVFLRVIFASVD